MGYRPLAVAIMYVHEYEIRIKKFKSGGLHEKHAVAIWGLGNQKKPVPMWLVAGPSGY